MRKYVRRAQFFLESNRSARLLCSPHKAPDAFLSTAISNAGLSAAKRSAVRN
jgi:hypothetical protein